MIATAKRYMTAFAAAALTAMAVSACGGGGGTTTTETPAPVDTTETPAPVDLGPLTDGFAADAGTLEIEAGESVDHGDIAFSCADDSVDCVVMVTVDTDGNITARSTGGMVTTMNSAAYQASLTPKDVSLSSLAPGYMAVAGTVTIEAGEKQVHGDIEFSCAAGRYDCEVMVTVAADGTIAADSTGGTVTAMNSDAFRESLTTRDVSLSSVAPGFTAEDDTVRIKAGEKEVHGDIEFSCSAGRYDCVVTVTVDSGGDITATKTGGTVTAMNAPGYPPETMPVDLSDLTVGFLADAITTLEIKAGESEDHDDIRFSCASGGRDCVVMVMVARDGTITATSRGGEVTATDAGDPSTLADQNLQARINAGHSAGSPNLEESGKPADGLGYAEITDAMYADIGGRSPTVYELETAATGSDPAMTDTLVIYSNTDFLTPTDFAEVHSLNADSNTALEIARGASAQVDLEMIGGENLPDTVPSNNSFSGTFDGASGEYRCIDNNDCTLTFDSDQNVTGVSGDMHFTPDVGATVLAIDPDYMYFGYWLRKSDDGSNDPSFEVAGLFGGAEPSIINDVQALEGSATYEGAATGLYVRRWFDANNDVVRRRTGQFTADALLEANFGGDTVPAVDHYSISGTISDFMAGGRAIDSD